VKHSRPVRIAVIGAGRLGGFHAQKLAQIDAVQFIGVVDPVEAQRNRVAAECRVPAFADYRPILDSMDAAILATPTQSHYELGMDLLDRGIHLLIEKPLAATADQAGDLVRAARRSGARLQVGHVERFNPALASALAAVDRPRYIEAVRAGVFTFRSMDIGVVLDLMIHDIDLVLSMVHGPLRKIEATGFSVLGGHEDVANARLEFDCGCVAVLSASRVSCEPARRMQIWSLGGFVAVDFATRKTTVVRPSETLLRRELDTAALAAERDEVRDRVLAEHLSRSDTQHDAVDALALELQDFIESILKSRPPRVSGEQGRDAVLVAEQVLAKIRGHGRSDPADDSRGPISLFRPRVVPAPHWSFVPESSPLSEV
jgi:predicted dehydrogenase